MQYMKIFSDSQAAIKALNSNVITSSTVKQTIESLNTVNQISHLEIFWIKAHIGHEGNERADQLVREAVKNSTISINTPLGSIQADTLSTDISRMGRQMVI